MARIEKTVFISYRRTNLPWARAIFQDLTQHGFDVFLDYTGVASGDFESVILENIHSRAHFLVLLTPSALERCGDPSDWLRREIEAALDSKRNIVPLMLEGFDFGTPPIATQLTGKLAILKQYNAISIPPEYFDAAMVKLRDKFLNVPLDAVLHPASSSAQQAATHQKGAAAKAPRVEEGELTAQQWFERGASATDFDEKIRFYSEAIRLKPDFADAFYNRGLARYNNGDLSGATEDYDQAIHLEPDYASAYYNQDLAGDGKLPSGVISEEYAARRGGYLKQHAGELIDLATFVSRNLPSNWVMLVPLLLVLVAVPQVSYHITHDVRGIWPQVVSWWILVWFSSCS